MIAENQIGNNTQKKKFNILDELKGVKWKDK